MQKVNSFIIDHKKLVPGIYECQVNGIFTYDVRFVKPQDAVYKGLFMDPKVAHTLEHFMADYLRTKTMRSSHPLCCMWDLWGALQDSISSHPFPIVLSSGENWYLSVWSISLPRRQFRELPSLLAVTTNILICRGLRILSGR
jgi:hypothetical protein